MKEEESSSLGVSGVRESLGLQPYGINMGEDSDNDDNAAGEDVRESLDLTPYK